SNNYLCLVAGSKLPGLRRALNKKPGAGNVDVGDEDLVEEDAPSKTVNADSVDQLPTRWFAYAGIDLLILTSGSERFISELAGDRTGRKEALAEWVRRGGRLLVSAGRNHQFVNSLLKGLNLIQCPIEGTVSQPRLILKLDLD